ncbi:FAD-dependent oxidoreductase [Ramlibacter sp. WS9]|uniref:flavin monoamine oxidase family protein n=1 Tax=Ramlibacter sp. WS9 TaxID=1882741 RepID=UPI001141C910|nr:FAD-dependent oxidoreductase [Ramlibacter sp. WS9]ROZ64437.1 FAD-dependent oxidoreductase [Ramlibacter sp. WS9]
MITRRALLGTSALPLLGCAPERKITGGFNGASPDRGHLLRQKPAATQDPEVRRCDVLIAGGGIAGLSAARVLRRAGVEDFALLELEDAAGGNSRAGRTGGLPCPLGAHYLPVPGEGAEEVRDLLEELGIARRAAGRWTYDERHLCHSPQDRLFINGQWQEGLLPMQVGASTLAQYTLFSRRVAQETKSARFPLPLRGGFAPSHRALDAVTFAAWLDREGLTDPHLRWYLDYCCRDDYGAGIAVVSAWAGVHYFASRHGFQAPGEEGERDAVLTWPEGNGWLANRLLQPLGERLHTGRVVLRITPLRQGVEVDAWDVAGNRMERWQAAQCIVALPLFVAERVMSTPPRALSEAVPQLRYSPWAVANVHIESPLQDRDGAPPAWDNVVYGGRGLGYVNAGHQNLNPLPEATVLTWYCALGDEPGGRARLLARPWESWRDEVLDALSVPHPDLRARTLRVDVARYGHAMATPTPGTRANEALAALRRPQTGLWRSTHFAHSDLSGYSVFEEAFTHGYRAGHAVLGALRVAGKRAS